MDSMRFHTQLPLLVSYIGLDLLLRTVLPHVSAEMSPHRIFAITLFLKNQTLLLKGVYRIFNIAFKYVGCLAITIIFL